MPVDERVPLLNNAYFSEEWPITTTFPSRPIATSGVNVNRRVYLQEELNQEHNYNVSSEKLISKFKKKLRRNSPINFIYGLIPAIKWMPRYKFKEDLFGDIASGITVAIMNIPQGMAYALLGNVPAIYGIYMAFFPVLVYTFLGTSRHISMGTFAIVCLMTGNVITQYQDSHEEYEITHLAGTVSFTVGIICLMMYLIRAGVIADLLSETLVSSFTCASAFHIISSQLRDLFGLSGVARTSGNFRLIKIIYRVGSAMPTANYCSLVISAVTMTILLLNNFLLKPLLAKKTKIPFPIELFVVVVGTTSSYFLDLNTNYNITIVGDIPTGFPEMKVPVFNIIPYIAYDCFFIAMVSYAITMSMALMFASKRNYDVRANQELFAMGISDIVGSFFCCMPITASLSRSVIQFEVGGATQMASIVSCSILIFVLLWLGPLFELLPKAVLASIIVVALKSMILQVTEIKRFWKLSKWDFTVWVCTFFTTLLVNIDIGLCVGLALSLASLFIRGYKPYTCLLGTVPGTDLYLDIRRYKTVKEIPGISIFRYSGGLNFASKASFKELLFKRIGFDPSKVYKKMKLGYESEVTIGHVIIDFSTLTFIDPQGVKVLAEIKDHMEKIGIQMYICCCSVPVYEVFQTVNRYYNKEEGTFSIFPTIHDAVLYAQGSLGTNFGPKS